MDELRKLLKEGKLTFRQYFIVAYELFKEMIKNDNKEIIVLYVLYLATVFFVVSQNPLFGMLTGIVTLVAISRIWLLYKKVIFKIEEREYDNNGNIYTARFFSINWIYTGSNVYALYLQSWNRKIVKYRSDKFTF